MGSCRGIKKLRTRMFGALDQILGAGKRLKTSLREGTSHLRLFRQSLSSNHNTAYRTRVKFRSVESSVHMGDQNRGRAASRDGKMAVQREIRGKNQREGTHNKRMGPTSPYLVHPAIGGFITDCGWNSTIEYVCSGVPMITWPLFAGKFLKEKFIVEILKVGVEVGAQVPVGWGKEEKVGVVVKRDGIEKALVKLMDGGEDAKGRRNAEELGAMTRKSMEFGGSSY